MIYNIFSRTNLNQHAKKDNNTKTCTNITTIMCKNYRDNCEERCCSGSHNQLKTLFKDYMLRLKIISLYI